MNERISQEINPAAIPESHEVKTPRGHNIEIVASFRRHFDPAKDERGMSLDKLTEKGKRQATELGPTLTGKLKAYASPKERAQDTIDIALANAGEGAEIINNELSSENQSATGRVFRVSTKKELDTVPNLAKLLQEAMAHAKERNASGDETPALDLTIQYLFDHPERAEALGAPSMHEIAQSTAARLDLYRRMSERLNDGSQVRLENITHGPKPEPLLKEIILRKDGDKVIKGFNNVSEIGGAFNPGENFDAVIKRDKQGNGKMTIRLRGQEYDVDMAELEKLAAEYKQRIKQTKKPSAN